MKKILLISLLILSPQFVRAEVLINEIMYDLEGTDGKREWIEIRVIGESVDVTSLKLNENDVDHSISLFQGNKTLNDGEYAIIADNPDQFLIDNPQISGNIFDSAFSLSNEGEVLKIIGVGGKILDEALYTKELGANGTGNSIQLNDGFFIAGSPTPNSQNVTSPADETIEDVSEDGDEPILSGGTSTHSSQIEITNLKPKVIKIGSGRNRIVSTKTPIKFDAIYNDEDLKGAKFFWSFGDGKQGSGSSIEHVYKYPGNYNVVLQAYSKSDLAISRSAVGVIKPSVDLFIEKIEDEYVLKIKNNGSELNIGQFYVFYNSKTFEIPKDTIISSNQTIILDREILGFEPLNVIFKYPSGDILAETHSDLGNIMDKIKEAGIKIDKIKVEKSLNKSLL